MDCVNVRQLENNPSEALRKVLLDDRLARRDARAAGLTVAGTAAIVGAARIRGLVPSAREVFARLLHSDFRISPQVIRAVLERVEK